MTESGKATAWVAVKVELESCEVWPGDLPCTEACTYEHEHEYAGECGEACAKDCDVDHPECTAPCGDPRQCREPGYDHRDSEGHRPDWSQADLSRAMLEQVARDYESGYDVVDPETHQYVHAGDLRVGPDRVEAWRWKAVPGTAQILARIEPAVTSPVTDAVPDEGELVRGLRAHIEVLKEEVSAYRREHGPLTRLCACGCGRPVTSQRPEAKYATGACRVRAHRAR